MYNREKRLALPLFVTLSMLIVACAAPSAIPVVERKQPPSERIYTHWVSQGETLYAIAWRYNMNVDDLARANGINQSYKIWSGQKLNLDLSQAVKRNVALSPTGKTGYSRKNQDSKQSKAMHLATWHWPTRGKILKSFSWHNKTGRKSGHKGMDISGQRGQAVRAAQSGIVVYAGSGLPAYGKLLIVKHNDMYLSAYAHNSRLIVVEGDSIKAGQKIAEIGSSGTTRNHLHFEIRKQGIPVNPMRFLPKV